MTVDEAERVRVLHELQRAVGDGVISLAEYESRSEALVVGGADAVSRATEGLAASTTTAVERQSPGEMTLRDKYTASLRVETCAWAFISTVNLVVWVACAMTVGPTYFWPVWVVGPWGVVLGIRWVVDRQMRSGRRSGHAPSVDG